MQRKRFTCLAPSCVHHACPWRINLAWLGSFRRDTCYINTSNVCVVTWSACKISKESYQPAPADSRSREDRPEEREREKRKDGRKSRVSRRDNRARCRINTRLDRLPRCDASHTSSSALRRSRIRRGRLIDAVGTAAVNDPGKSILDRSITSSSAEPTRIPGRFLVADMNRETVNGGAEG